MAVENHQQLLVDQPLMTATTAKQSNVRLKLSFRQLKFRLPIQSSSSTVASLDPEKSENALWSDRKASLTGQQGDEPRSPTLLNPQQHQSKRKEGTQSENNSTVKKLKLIVKNDSSEQMTCSSVSTGGQPLTQAVKQPQRIKLRCNGDASSQKNQIQSSNPWKFPQELPKWCGSTKERAHEIVRWALKYNANLLSHYDVRQILGWGGCGCVLGAIRISDQKEVFIAQSFSVDIRETSTCLSKYFQQ